MHPGIIASRKATAQDRSKEAVRKLTKKFKLDIDPEILTPVSRDPVVLDMLKAEAFADVLEALADTLAKGKAKPEPVEEQVDTKKVK